MDFKKYNAYSLRQINLPSDELINKYISDKEIVKLPSLGIILFSVEIFSKSDISKLSTVVINPIGTGNHTDSFSFYIEGEQIEPDSKFISNLLDDSKFKPGGKSNIIFKNCTFENAKSPLDIPLRENDYAFFFIGCTISAIHLRDRYLRDDPDDWRFVENMFQTLQKCTIQYLRYNGVGNLKIGQNTIIREIETNSPGIRLENCTISALHHTHLDGNLNFSFGNVMFKFDQKLLAKHGFKGGLLNTLPFLISNEGLADQRVELEKARYYLESRKRFFHRMLFLFNKGYTGWIVPTASILLLILAKFTILYFNPSIVQVGPQWLHIIYPYELLRGVVLKSPLNLAPDYIRIILIPLEILYIYSIFSLATYLKRTFGFKPTN